MNTQKTDLEQAAAISITLNKRQAYMYFACTVLAFWITWQAGVNHGMAFVLEGISPMLKDGGAQTPALRPSSK